MTQKEITDVSVYRADPVKMAALEKLAGGFAHDINNILGAIEGYASLAHDSLAPGTPARRDLESIREAVKAAAGLTARLLVFSRKRAINREACRATDLARAAAEKARGLAPANVSVELSLPDALPELLADPLQAGALFDNLVRNAFAAMPAGGTLTIGAAEARFAPAETRCPWPDEAGEDFVRFFVRDTGLGMDAATAARVFEPFFSGKPGGKGLGLALVYGLAGLHNGWAEAKSTPGKGSEFSVFIPANRRPA